MNRRPVEIAGGGLAGLSLALALQRAGVAVTLLEAGTYPRHRVCGEFITGLDVRTRQRLGLDAVLADARPNREVAWFSRGRFLRVQSLPAVAPSLSRHTLDLRLAEAFVAAGGTLLTQTRAVQTGDAPGRVFATGRRRTSGGWLGLKIHALNLPLARDLELHLGDHAYVGLARIEQGRVNICGLFQRRDLCAKGWHLLPGYLQAAGLPELAVRIVSADLDRASFSAVAAVGFDHRVPPVDEVRIGDASAMIPPFTGHGMAMAFQSAEIALDPLLAYAAGRQTWSVTRQQIHTRLQRRFRLRLFSARWLHPFLFRTSGQRWLTILDRVRLIPWRPLYAALH